MSIAYLLFGLLFATGAATFALLNGAGLLMAVVAYGAAGALAILVPLALHAVFDVDTEADWTEAPNNTLSA